MRIKDGTGNELLLSEALVDAAQRNVRVAFGQEATPQMLIRLSEVEQALTEAQIAAIRKAKKPEIACKKGCAWCCHAYISLSAPEVLHLAGWMQANFSAAELDAAKQRVAEAAERKAGLNWMEQEKLRHPCPLLAENACSVYSARPLACRGFSARDAEACRLNATDDPRAADRPVQFYLPFKSVAAAVRVGLQRGVDETPFQNDNFGLIPALHAALNTPDILVRWLAGEAVFPPETREEQDDDA